MSDVWTTSSSSIWWSFTMKMWIILNFDTVYILTVVGLRTSKKGVVVGRAAIEAWWCSRAVNIFWRVWILIIILDVIFGLRGSDRESSLTWSGGQPVFGNSTPFQGTWIRRMTILTAHHTVTYYTPIFFRPAAMTFRHISQTRRWFKRVNAAWKFEQLATHLCQRRIGDTKKSTLDSNISCSCLFTDSVRESDRIQMSGPQPGALLGRARTSALVPLFSNSTLGHASASSIPRRLRGNQPLGSKSRVAGTSLRSGFLIHHPKNDGIRSLERAYSTLPSNYGPQELSPSQPQADKHREQEQEPSYTAQWVYYIEIKPRLVTPSLTMEWFCTPKLYGASRRWNGGRSA